MSFVSDIQITHIYGSELLYLSHFLTDYVSLVLLQFLFLKL